MTDQTVVGDVERVKEAAKMVRLGLPRRKGEWAKVRAAELEMVLVFAERALSHVEGRGGQDSSGAPALSQPSIHGTGGSEAERLRDQIAETIQDLSDPITADWGANEELVDRNLARLREVHQALSAPHRDSSGGEGWRPIETAPKDDTMFLAVCADGRMMIWRGSILASALSGKTPNHLQFPATHWRPLPAAPTLAAAPHRDSSGLASAEVERIIDAVQREICCNRPVGGCEGVAESADYCHARRVVMGALAAGKQEGEGGR